MTRICLLAVAAGCLLPADCAAGAKRPNVLFVNIDDLGNFTGYLGHPVVRTPNLDKLARRGVAFTRAYCQYPVCNPSRTSFLTGLRPGKTGVLDNKTPFRDRLPDAWTLPQWFRQHGYHTVRFGKIFHDTQPFDDPKAWDAVEYPEGTPAGQKGEGRNLTGGELNWCRWLAAEGGDSDQADGVIADKAIHFLENRPKDQPFFLAVGFHKPHDPFVAPKKYFAPYPLEKLPLPQDPADRTPDVPFALAGFKKSFDKFTDRERREFTRAYFAGTTYMDAQLGRVLAALDRLGLTDDTIIVVLSDHGYHLGERNWWNKNTLFELSCRAPLIVAVPGGGQKGHTCERIVEFVDIFPTLTDLCRLKTPQGLDGQSFRPLIEDPTRAGKEAAFTVVSRGKVMGKSVRTDRWRYTEWDGGKAGVELYDHRTDPGEYYNLAGATEHADVRRELSALLRRLDAPSGAP